MANAIEILINAKDNASGSINTATMSVGALAKGVLASVGAFAAAELSMRAVQQAVVGISTSFANEVEQLGRLSHMTGLTNEQLQIFRRGLERNGLQADQLGLALRFFQNQLAGNRKELAMYGITADDTFGALVQLRRALEGAGTDAERTELAAKTLGMRNVELAQTVTDVAANYKDEFSAALAGGAVMSEQMQRSMADLDEKMDNFRDTVRSLKLAIAEAFGPMLAALVGMLNLLNRGKSAMDAFAGSLSGDAVSSLARLLGLPRGGGGADFGPEVGASEPFDQAGWMARYKQRMALARTGGDITEGLGGLYSTAGPALAQRDSTPQHLMDLGKNLKSVDVPVLKLSDDLLLLRDAAYAFGSGLEQNFAQAFHSLIAGTQNVRQAFDTLLRGIMQSITDAIVQMLARIAASYALEGIGSLIPGPWGKAISGAGKIMGGRSSLVGGGGNTFVLQSISMKDAYDSLTSVTGTMRGAGDRVREVAMAGSL